MKVRGCFGRTVLRGSVLIVLATVVGGQAATSSQAPQAPTRMTATNLNAAMLRPVWIFGDNAPKTLTGVAPSLPSVVTAKPIMVSSGTAATGWTPLRVRVRVGAPAVQVPARPLPRDPFSPR